MKLPVGTINFAYNDSVPKPDRDLELRVRITAPDIVASNYANNLSVQATSKTTTIAQISVADAHPMRGIDFINRLIDDYNQDANDEKNAVAKRTAEFIDERIKAINEELGETEDDIASYKRKTGVTNLATDAQVALNQKTAYDQQRTALATQVAMAEYMRNYVNDPSHNNDVIPVNVGLEDKSLTTSINQYNELVLERQRLLQTSTPEHPQVIQLNSQIAAMHEAVKTNVESTIRGLRIAQNDLSRQAGAYQGMIARSPEQEKELNTYGRLQTIKSELYMMLLQKREENLITLAATANNGRIIEEPMASSVPKSPRRSMIYLIALVLGLGLPFAIIWLREQLKYKIENSDDIKKLTDVPIVSEIPYANNVTKQEGSIVVHENKNDLMEEAFRNLRTNLLFMLKPGQQVIQFTPTTFKSATLNK